MAHRRGRPKSNTSNDPHHARRLGGHHSDSGYGQGTKKTGRTEKKSASDLQPPLHLHEGTPLPSMSLSVAPSPTLQINTATYTLNVGPSQIQFDFHTSEHATRGLVLQTYGFPDFRAASREGMI